MAFKNEEFVELIYLASDGVSGNSGKSSLDPLNFANKDDIFVLPAGTVVTEVDVVITAALSGVTEMELGDDSSDVGFASSGNITYGTAGAYRGNGAYISGANKYYAAETGLNLDVVGTASSGTAVLRVKGYRL